MTRFSPCLQLLLESKGQPFSESDSPRLLRCWRSSDNHIHVDIRTTGTMWHVFGNKCFQHNQFCTCRWSGLWSLEAEFSVTWAVVPYKKTQPNTKLDKKQPDLYKPVTLTYWLSRQIKQMGKENTDSIIAHILHTRWSIHIRRDSHTHTYMCTHIHVCQLWSFSIGHILIMLTKWDPHYL